MKCIHCGTDSKLRERAGKRCPVCRHPFAVRKRTGLTQSQQSQQSLLVPFPLLSRCNDGAW
jgi:DNA-directed RNA polymerase subunit RPC12/RpoP